MRRQKKQAAKTYCVTALIIIRNKNLSVFVVFLPCDIAFFKKLHYNNLIFFEENEFQYSKFLKKLHY